MALRKMLGGSSEYFSSTVGAGAHYECEEIPGKRPHQVLTVLDQPGEERALEQGESIQCTLSAHHHLLHSNTNHAIPHLFSGIRNVS
jgi:hypothetical protein